MDLEVNPREVLRCLNELGVRNVTASELKEFIKNLKKLIKYERQIGLYDFKDDIANQPIKTREKEKKPKRKEDPYAHITSKIYTDDNRTYDKKSNDNKGGKRSVVSDTPYSSIATQTSKTEPNKCSCDRNCCCRRPQTPNVPKRSESVSRKKPTNNMTCDKYCCCSDGHKRSESVARRKNSTCLVRNTPNDLYQFYNRDWERFKQLMPGYDRSDVRLAVKKRMQQKPEAKPRVFITKSMK